MAERYKRLFSLDSAKYADGAPLLICAGSLLDDRLSHSIMAQFRFKNISDNIITAVKLVIEPFDAAGRSLDPVEYMYQGLQIPRDEDFGQKTAVIIPDSSACSYKVRVVQVIFNDGSIWQDEESPWESTKSPRTLLEAYGDSELSAQFAIRYGDDCTYLPQDDRGLWFCACGLVNHEHETKCHGCRRVYSALKAVNISSLRSESLQRQQLERRIEKEDEELSKKKKKSAVIWGIVLIPVLAALIFLAMTVPEYMAQKKAYSNAQMLLGAGKYDMAQEAFMELGDYADSMEKAIYEVPYAKGVYLMDCAAKDDIEGLLLIGRKRSELSENETVSVALYNEADSLFAALGDYKDAPALRQTAQEAVQAHYDALKKADYDAAKAALDEGLFLASRDAFNAMGNYLDSADLAKEALYQRAIKLYELTEKYSMRGIFSKISNSSDENSVIYIAQSAFAELGSQLSADFREICKGDGVEILIEDPPSADFAPICSDISRLFNELGSYKNSEEYAKKAVEAGDFTKPFYDMCAEGRLYEAYVWLEGYDYAFDSKDAWLNVLKSYIPYCGTWEMSSGDPTLIPMTIGVQLPCGSFTSAVKIKDFVITLSINVNGNTSHPIELPLAAEGGRFSVNNDGINTYIANLSDKGTFIYSKYSSYAINAQTNSCEYVRIG